MGSVVRVVVERWGVLVGGRLCMYDRIFCVLGLVEMVVLLRENREKGRMISLLVSPRRSVPVYPPQFLIHPSAFRLLRLLNPLVSIHPNRSE